jgi:hypothetical protein
MMRTLPVFALAGGVSILGACSGSDPMSMNQMELQAKAQASINGMQAELNGQFRSEAEGQRLTGEVDNLNLAAGTNVSFCLAQGSGSKPLAVSQINMSMVQFTLNTQSGQMVSKVNVGDTLEARQGATGSGMADCSAMLLVSASFQPDVDQPNH